VKPGWTVQPSTGLFKSYTTVEKEQSRQNNAARLDRKRGKLVRGLVATRWAAEIVEPVS
jgi:hypothetical protein